MHHRIASFLLGCWILGSLFMMFVATGNFKIADAAQDAHTRQLLRLMAGQANQMFFLTWELAQIILAAALAGLFFFGVGSRLLASLSTALLLVTVSQHFWITPEMVALTAQLDSAASANRFAMLHAVYGVLEVLKLLIALVIAGILLPAWKTRHRNVAELQPIHDSR